jgi:YidC/Oxa1 family membrane protein insertase
MEKRLVAAVVLSAAILFGWQFLVARFYPAAPPAPPSNPVAPLAEQSVPPPPTGEAPPTASTTVAGEPERTVEVQTSRWVARFSNKGGVATSWILLIGPEKTKVLAADYSPLELVPQTLADRTTLPFALVVDADTARLNGSTYRVESQGNPAGDTITIADGETSELAFVGTDPVSGQQVSKTFTFTGGRYDFGIKVATSEAAQPLPLAMVVGPRIGDQSIKVEGGYNAAPPHVVVATASGKVYNVLGSEVENGAKPIEGSARWGGVADNYFTLIVARSGAEAGQAFAINTKAKFDPAEEKLHDFPSAVLPVASNGLMYAFIGPKDHESLEHASEAATAALATPVDFDGLINYGWFAFLVRPLIAPIDWALRFIDRFTGNYGVAIIIVTALVNLLFFPLRYKSTVSMRKAAKLQPRMKELQAKMKKLKMDDPEYKKLQSEQMELMRQGNPLGGCLPLLLQLPIFWAFFNYFTTSFVVRQQPFFAWVRDLSSHDPYYVLPVVMCAAQIGSTMLTPMPNSDDPALKMQRMLMTWVMPIVFAVFFFASAPSGLMLYWLTTNVAGIGIQLAINKMLPPDQQNQNGAGVTSGKGPKGKQKGSGTEPSPELAGSV